MYIPSKIQDLRIYYPMVYCLSTKKGAGYSLINRVLNIFFPFLLQIITK